jgi:hypothetical protein
MSLPTESDFPGDPDGRVAREHFLGRTPAEAEALFLGDPYIYFEDLMWMGPGAFRFYAPAAVSALLNGAASYEWGYPLDVFARTLEQELTHDPEKLRPIAAQLAAACSEILARWSTFGDIQYDGLPDRYAALQDVFHAQTAA